MEPRYRSLMLALQPQPRQMPPPPFDKDELQRIFADVIRHHRYQSFGFTPNERGAIFGNDDEDNVELRPALLRIQARMDGADVLTSGAAQEKAQRIMKIAGERLKIENYLQCAVQIIASVDAPEADARAFVGKHLLRDPEQASGLGADFFGGGVRFRRLRPQEGGEDNLSIEPDVNDNALVYVDFQMGRSAVGQPISLEQAMNWVNEAFEFVQVPTMALLSD
jgi:hypothetical protein